MAEIRGTNVSAPVVPFTDQDIYATHDAKYGKGGYRSVKSLDDLDKIPELRLDEGMVVYVIDDPSGIHNYQYLGGKWVRSRLSQGIPVYNQKLIDDLGINPSKDSYISIPDPSDLTGEVVNQTFTTTENGTYIDVLFKAIRALQSEVAKLKNSFEYGIESYTGTTTAMSDITAKIDSVEEEPLWAIMEGNLSEVLDIPLGDGHDFKPLDKVEVIIDPQTTFTYLKTKDSECTWESKDEDNKSLLDVGDTKLFTYLTTKGRDLKMTLDVYDGYFLVNSKKYEKVIDLSKLYLSKRPESGLYNTLIVISRSQKMSDGNYYGKNFIWISMTDADTNEVLTEGYWNNDKIFTDPIEFEKDFRYNIKNVKIKNLDLIKFKIYSKWQDFSHEVIPSQPSEQDYKFKAAHITIRSVDSQKTLESVKNQILNNELIFVEDTKRLWIKSNNKLTIIAGGGEGSGGDEGGDTGMSKEELIKTLKEMGIVQESNGDLSVSNLTLEDITFIHQATGRRFKFYIDGSGNLRSQRIADPSTSFSNILKENSYKMEDDIRGFIGNLNTLKSGYSSRETDMKLGSDRLKIGSFYAPFKSDILHGCSHSFIELENTSNVDINLEGCYLHYTKPDESLNQQIYHLALTGVIPAGGTYLIRGKQHAEFTDSNVYLKVKTFDQEWYYESSRGQFDLLSFEIDENPVILDSKDKGYGFVITYGNNFGGTEKEPSPLTEKTELMKSTYDGLVVNSGSTSLNTLTINSSNKSYYPYLLNKYFIDALYYYKMVENTSGTAGYWAMNPVKIKHNSIYRNSFELDPAKQAFQAFTTRDSSRARWSKDKDYQIVVLDKEYLSFPHTDDIYPISNYTPKASFEKRNVCTDKTKLDKNKPNMVTSSFGIDIYKTRCFNWVSIGYFPEYIWIKKGNPGTETPWEKRIQSYLPIQGLRLTSVTTVDSEIEDPEHKGQQIMITTTNVIADVVTDDWISGESDITKYTVLTDSTHNKLFDVTLTYSSESRSYTFSVSGDQTSSLNTENTYYLHQKIDDLTPSSEIYPRRKNFSENITNQIYSRITGRFPADNSFYTVHKAVIDIVNTNVEAPTTYTYVVGRADKNGNPDLLHTSEEMTFTLYPTSYKTKVYQITDQQGFNWLEYQVWAAVAKKLNERIAEDQLKSHIIPVLINTGDMTQNGTRINEWYDYYQAGRELFDHLEQMNVVGNNDLCGPDPEELGTGDDSGKSNAYYFHVFYCYEVEGTLEGGHKFTPLIYPKNSDNDRVAKYVPSLYYFDSDSVRYLMVNSEITETTCKTWFKCMDGVSTPESLANPINIYTGYTIVGENNTYVPGFTTIYTMLWRILNDAKAHNKKVVAVCHEMPFTVITSGSLTTAYAKVSRSLSNDNKLIGSHLNQISANERGSGKSPKGIYWFSRLLEFYKVKLVLGGHKHTYTCSYPVRENYFYQDKDVLKKSAETGPMDMPETLENDSINFMESSEKDLSKFPLVKREDVGPRTDGIGFYPCTCVPSLTGGVVYFMCQASGYKLTSNKELPSPDQKYTRVLPRTKSTFEKGKYKDSPNNDQKVPMFAIIEESGEGFSIKLARVQHVFSNYKFDQYNSDKDSMTFEWLTENYDEEGKFVDNFGKWSSVEKELFKVD